jgi:peptidoglycan biosynthesis protein MviN/MurJ (putative lipid II flippase)
MFLRAGALSLALLLASRLLGVVRESALAASFGSSGLADAAILMLTLPDWLASVLASGALAYVLLPAWAGRTPAQIAALQRTTAKYLLGGSLVLALALAALHPLVLRWLAPGLPPDPQGGVGTVLLWSAAALPAAFVAALWATRLQHERDFLGLYGGNLVVNAVLVAGIAAAASLARPLAWLGGALLLAMGLRLAWLGRRLPTRAAPAVPAATGTLPLPGAWLAAIFAAGLPLALPFVARSAASQGGEGALATFNYAWKLVELPLVLAIQLVASLAFPAIARAHTDSAADRRAPVRQATVLAWTLACAAVAALQAGGAGLAQLLFGWGRMDSGALAQVARWGQAGSWGLLPQALTAVALTVLAARGRMHVAVWAHAVALAGLLAAAWMGVADGFALMHALNLAYLFVAAACVAGLVHEHSGQGVWQAMLVPVVPVLAIAMIARAAGPSWSADTAGAGVLVASASAVAVLAFTLWRSTELRAALRR